MKRIALSAIAMIVLTVNGGCYRPFEPNKLETIGPNEEGFLIPLSGDTTKQTSKIDHSRVSAEQGKMGDNSEALYRNSIIDTKQVRIPQQWKQTGYEWFGSPNGQWIDAAILIKVDRSPVTREWTADPMSGTSNRNEAVWVMTADQVEFSTGWTCTARIPDKEGAVKFLHNYPNGSLQRVMDHEIRSKLQSEFGLEVTDLPMEKLRIAATPHIQNVAKRVTGFFAERGISITNLGITGGFVYKDPSIQAKMVEVFNAEQERSIAAAQTLAQNERNNKIRLEAEAKSNAILIERKAEAEGILAVAEARRKEAEVVQGNPSVYMTLRKVELEKEKLARWNGSFPQFYMNGQGSSSPDLLLQVPAFTNEQGK